MPERYQRMTKSGPVEFFVITNLGAMAGQAKRGHTRLAGRYLQGLKFEAFEKHAPRPYRSRSVQAPVSRCEEATGFDSGDPLKRRKIDRTTTTAVDRNSDCQFCRDSNQNCALARWSTMVIGG